MGLVFLLLVIATVAMAQQTTFNGHRSAAVKCVGAECPTHMDHHHVVDCAWNTTREQWEDCRVLIPINYTIVQVNVSCTDADDEASCSVTYRMARVTSSDMVATMVWEWFVDHVEFGKLAELAFTVTKIILISTACASAGAAAWVIAAAVHECVKIKRA